MKRELPNQALERTTGRQAHHGSASRAGSPLNAKTLGDSCRTLGTTEDNPDPNSEACEHVDQGVNAEEIEAPTHQVAYARLRNVE